MTAEPHDQAPAEIPNGQPPVTVPQLLTIAGLVAGVIVMLFIVGDILLDTLFPEPPIIESLEHLGRELDDGTALIIERRSMLDGGPRLIGRFTLDSDLAGKEEQRIVGTVEDWAAWQSWRYAFADFVIVVEDSQGRNLLSVAD
ncbi:hypothetical protein [Salinibacterium sp. ZJ454]|uniref:hypothetical protein n=1 Tax=Salinibacterium sp. ZJ454 TaxID=2708339 RepID=UPI001423DBA6|nr:hypothetical protein [Salinibacterium sp. ZJ454]